jgi:glycosyltransferase involved in cell wall biosynthesis
MQTRFTLGAIRNIRKYYPDIEVIVVDDGSDELGKESDFRTAYARGAYFREERFDNDMGGLLDGVFKLDARIKLIGRHVGHGSAIDYGLDEADTPLILTMDNDIRLREGGLVEEYLEKLNEDTQNIYAVGTTFTENLAPSVGKWIDPWFSLYQKNPIKALHLTFSNFIFPIDKERSFHLGTGGFLHTMMTYKTLHRPKIWKAVYYPEPEMISQLWHMKRYKEDLPDNERVINWDKYIDG